MEQDLVKPELNELVPDDIPTDGIPISDEGDDEPIVVE
jgi:hypothetical protein